MFKDLIISLKISLFTLVVMGVLYPLLITGLSHVFFYKKATGSFLLDESKNIVGSELIGQNFTNPAYFFSRPSAAGKGYDGTQSGGANLGPTSKKLFETLSTRVTHLKKFNTDPIPIELVTTSASGLDPHLSLEAAYWQASRIALYRNVSLKRIILIIEEQAQSPLSHLLGRPYVNVLKLNLTLDQFFGPPKEKK